MTRRRLQLAFAFMKEATRLARQPGEHERLPTEGRIQYLRSASSHLVQACVAAEHDAEDDARSRACHAASAGFFNDPAEQNRQKSGSVC
jgi:hypothetical protein